MVSIRRPPLTSLTYKGSLSMYVGLISLIIVVIALE